MNELPKEALSYEPIFPWMMEELTHRAFCPWDLNVQFDTY